MLPPRTQTVFRLALSTFAITFACAYTIHIILCLHYACHFVLVDLQPGIVGHVVSDQYGKYGVIRESDLASKISEFQQWATEVKKVNIEAMAKWEEKELFAEFMEDYNTGTLPHRKYYDLMAYAQQQAIKAAKKGRNAGVSPHTELHQLACHSPCRTDTSCLQRALVSACAL